MNFALPLIVGMLHVKIFHKYTRLIIKTTFFFEVVAVLLDYISTFALQ